MATCVVLAADGTLQPTGQPADQCAGYVLLTAAEHESYATLGELFGMPTVAEAQEIFVYGFGLVLLLNVAGYMVGAVVKMVSTDRD